MKTFRLLGLVLCFLISMSSYADTVVTIGGLKYTLNGTEAYVSGSYIANPTDVLIPATIESDGLTFRVTRILASAFEGCTSLKSVRSEGSNLRSIERKAFYSCTSLETISFPSVKTISYAAFEYCTSLETVSLPSVEEICGAFSRCSRLRAVYLGNCLKRLSYQYISSPYHYYYAFENCTSLSYIVIPATCTEIYSETFTGCSRLQAIIYLGEKSLGQQGSNAAIYMAKDLISWSENEFSYSGKVPIVTPTSQLPAGFAISSYNLGALNKDAGTYTQKMPFTFANADMSFDVEIPYTYTINKVPLNINVKDATKEYGNDNPSFNAEYTGFVNGEGTEVLTSMGTFSTSATKTSNAGTYPIMLNGVSAKNYDVSNVSNGILTINKAPLEIYAGEYVREMGENNPTFYAKYTGWKNNDTENSLTTKPVFTCSATKESPVGKYDITVSGASSPNYDITYRKGILNVTSSSNWFKLTYIVDGEVFKSTLMHHGDVITPEVAPAKEGYTFTGWDGLPSVMPAHDVTVTAIYVENGSGDDDPSGNNNVLFFERTDAFTGKSLTLSLKMNNTQEITGFQCDIYLPEGVSFAKNADGEYDVALNTTRTTASRTNIFDAALQNDGALRILASSTKSAVFNGNSGEVVTIVVNVAENLPDGEYPLVIRNTELSDKYGTSYSVPIMRSTLNVMSYIIGDVNADLKVNVADITVIANHILGLATPTFVRGAADLNEDTKVNVADITCLSNLILYGDIHGAINNAKPMLMNAETGGLDTSAQGNALYFEDVTVNESGEAILSMKMNNEYAVTGFQCKVYLPEGVTIQKDEYNDLMVNLSLDRTTASNTNIFDYAVQSDGSLLLLVSSTKSRAFSGNEGEVATMKIKVGPELGCGEYEVALKEIAFSDQAGISHDIEDAVATLTINGTTGITDVENNKNANEVSRYLIDGTKVHGQKKGLNIVRMSDGTTKKVFIK